MRLLSFLAVGLAASTNLVVAYSHALPGAYIVELVNDVPSSESRRGLVTPHRQLYDKLEALGVSYEVRKEFHHEIFTGLFISLANQDTASFSSIPVVKSIRPARLWDRIKVVNPRVLDGSSDVEAHFDGQSAHRMTGVDKLHALGYFGKNVTVGVVDTGIDYTHPALGGGFGPGHKVAFGFDFVGDAYTGQNTPVPDPDPIDQCDGHGTHVAGIIGANPGNPYNISGVAYEATLAAYRVLGCSGGTSDDVMIEAFLKAYDDGCDVINISIGGPQGWTEGPAGVVASRIADRGRIVSVAAGNSGFEGAMFAQNPATGISVLSVGSVENSARPLQDILTSTGYGPINYVSLQPYDLPPPFKTDTFYPIYALSTDTNVVSDGCETLPPSTPDLTGKIVIVRRGGCPGTQKFRNIAAKGGNMSIIYDNDVEPVFSSSTTPYYSVLVSSEDGVYLVHQFAAGNNFQVKFSSTGQNATVPDPSGGLINAFSNWGPTNDMYFNPSLSGPGGNIVSTYPVPLKSFFVASGTSMSSPYVAGSAALLLQKNGKSSDVANGARTLFQTTSVPIPQDKSSNSPLQSCAQAGAGLINVYNALTFSTTLSPGELLLNDTSNYRPVHSLTLRNNGKKQQSYLLEHHPAATANTIGPDGIQPLTTPVQTADHASVDISPSKVTLQPGQSAEIVVTITRPGTGNTRAFPVFSGFIEATSSFGEKVHTSYLGLNANATDLVVIDNTSRYFGFIIPAILNPSGDVQAPGTSYTLNGTDVPTLVYRLASGSPVVYIDLVSTNTTFLPTDKTARRRSSEDTLFERNLCGTRAEGDGTFSSVSIIGSVGSIEYHPRNANDTYANFGYVQFPINTFANGTTFPKGSYKLLIRALKIAANPEPEASYESWLSTPFSVV